MATHFHQLTIADIRKETPDCVSIAFAVPDDLKITYLFKQGQNLTLRTVINNEEIRRSYSICTSPADNELRVAIKKAPYGKFSVWANNLLKKGDVLEVLPPTGTFFTELNPDHKKRYLAFAAGSGITPIISIIKTTLQTEPNSTFTLVFGNQNRSNIIFKEQLEALKNKYINRLSLHFLLSREQTDATIYSGRIDTDKLNQLSEKLIDVQGMDDTFICGPEQMIFTVLNWLQQQGIDKKKIHFELFTTPGQKAEVRSKKTEAGKEEGATTEKSKVTVKLDGIAFDFDLPYEGETVLEAALQQGADLPFSCKGGVCSTCKAKLIEGRVNMDTNYALEQEEVDAGYILTCQSHPRTEKVVIDFDVK
ncbi:phenylacetate-CoA oxygenase/reductase subunit PaaK [Niastella caeni]|uniref:Phenylacetate-CoA oxygenase/reductase subunit PaaK n=1 Tax=Niastella caeni TaxID=2569763 RepID=A0A4S8HNN1_9BACT|nr:1,2-phenylacetyl-CoA epoxidase subunit PaaE [Niastella caeni]THU36990.1 phenylacetate-CoA oxygenase/reductase subunit PaaK [Niastella caeni]